MRFAKVIIGIILLGNSLARRHVRDHAALLP